MPEPDRPYTEEQMKGDAVSKKDLATFIQGASSTQFLMDHKLKGALKNVVKTKSKDDLIVIYNQLFESKSFKVEGDEEDAAATASAAASHKSGDKPNVNNLTERVRKISVKEDEPKEPPKYKKATMKKGDKTNFPRKGDTVSCFYKGTLPDGTVFDQNIDSGRRGKKAQPLKFKVGVGNVIKGWDEGIQTMSAGEKAQFIIEPEWAYGKKGLEGKIPANTKLTFEVELININM